MSRAAASSYTLTSSTRHCAATGRELATGEPFIAVLALNVGAAGEGSGSGGAGGGGGGGDYERQDFSIDAWNAGARPRQHIEGGGGDPAAAPALPILGFWRATMPEPGARKRMLVDDDALLDLFEQTETDAGAADQAAGTPANPGDAAIAPPTDDERLAFRFFLALILMRKKLLICEKVDKDGTMHVRPKGSLKPAEGGTLSPVVDPKLDDSSMNRVLVQLSAVLGQG